MSFLKVYINNTFIDWSPGDNPIDVKDSDYVHFEFKYIYEVESLDQYPTILVEDYELPIFYYEDTGNYRTESFNVFRESFGYSVSRLYLSEQEFYEVIFNVHISKNKAKHVEEIINYLIVNNEKILDLCLSRTSVNLSNTSHESANIESFLNEAETIIDKMMEVRQELKYSLKKRLTPVLINSSIHLSDLTPFDILNNIDRLKPDDLNHNFLFKGRGFSLSGGEIWNLKENSNLFENHVLIGALYSIYDKINEINDSCFSPDFLKKTSAFDKEYESLDGMYIRITVGGLQKRCYLILEKISDLIIFFRDTLKVDYKGAIYPIITPFVRSFKVYNVLFHQIALWYDLGNPSLQGSKSLTKIRSVSKLYELMCFYKFIEYFDKNNWKFISIEKFTSDDLVPSVVNLSKDEIHVSLKYEHKIPIPNFETENLDLVDISHNKNAEYPYWNPDFILRVESNKVHYLIFDSKFSSFNSLKKYNVLSKLFEKYYSNIGIVDINSNIIHKNGIDGVIALYPNYDNKIMKYWSKPASIFKISPMINAVPLTTEINDIFDEVINEYFHNII